MKTLNKKQNDCENKTILPDPKSPSILTGDNELVTRETIKMRCSKDCTDLSLCHALLNLMHENKADRASELLKEHHSFLHNDQAKNG